MMRKFIGIVIIFAMNSFGMLEKTNFLLNPSELITADMIKKANDKLDKLPIQTTKEG